MPLLSSARAFPFGAFEVARGRYRCVPEAVFLTSFGECVGIRPGATEHILPYGLSNKICNSSGAG
jgi:hypothetical protein